MALRPFLLLLLPLLLTATLLIAQAQGIGSSAYDCCLNHSNKTIPDGVVTSYRLQGPASGCVLSAVVFTTRRKKHICASPTDGKVLKLMKHLDKKAKNKKKRQTQRSKDRPKKQRRQQV